MSDIVGVELILAYVETLAWPVVVIIGILVLGPGGLLIRIADRLGSTVSDFTRALPELNRTALTMRSDVETLVGKSKEMSQGFSQEFTEIERRIETLGVKMSTSLLEMKSVIDELDRSRLAEDKAAIDQAIEPDFDNPSGEYEDLSGEYGPDEMMDNIRSSWAGLVEALRLRAGQNDYFDARQIGFMAARMADGRRTHPIPKHTAELIQTLHSQFKRFSRMAATRSEWLTADVYSTFERGIEQVIKGLRG